ncbi:YopX family protein [Pedobacter sp.]|uniref:YopX family protein n=1 Tax=Pedobacter sp. TaxID=1411316 RepID=UPI003C33CFDA
MNREIKFRGKTRKDGRWFYGLPAYTSGGEIGVVSGWIDGDFGLYDSLEVIGKTVSQYTGLKDKNDVEIYDGDILETERGKNMIVSWNEKFASFSLSRQDWAFTHWFGESCDPIDCTIIGNIHDNPELVP